MDDRIGLDRPTRAGKCRLRWSRWTRCDFGWPWQSLFSLRCARSIGGGRNGTAWLLILDCPQRHRRSFRCKSCRPSGHAIRSLLVPCHRHPSA